METLRFDFVILGSGSTAFGAAKHFVTLGKNLVDDAEVVKNLERPCMHRAGAAMRIDAGLLVDDADRRAMASQFTSHCEPRRASADNQDR